MVDMMMEMAKQLVISVYGINPHIADIRNKCGRWNDKKFNGYSLHCGMFRQTLIPDNHKFVIKTGLTVGGNRQCKRELDFYNDSVTEGVEEFFAKCYGKFKIGAVCFYVYEYVRHIGQNDLFEELNDSEWDDVPFYWMAFDDADTVSTFCENHDINDLHNENFGFRHGHAVLTDYSGFWWEDKNGQKTIYSNRWD